jgi:hypothetical protein
VLPSSGFGERKGPAVQEEQPALTTLKIGAGGGRMKPVRLAAAAFDGKSYSPPAPVGLSAPIPNPIGVPSPAAAAFPPKNRLNDGSSHVAGDRARGGWETNCRIPGIGADSRRGIARRPFVLPGGGAHLPVNPLCWLELELLPSLCNTFHNRAALAATTKESDAMSLLMLLVAWVASGTLLFSQPAAPADTSGYVWDAACKDCHAEIHAAWARTKHKTALNRLSAADQEKDCAGCHLTGSLKPVVVETTIVNTGVQCESCHGPGRAHAESAKAGTPAKFAKKPAEPMCVECHNSKSPHFHGFFYSAMKPLVHKTSS